MIFSSMLKHRILLRSISGLFTIIVSVSSTLKIKEGHHTNLRHGNGLAVIERRIISTSTLRVSKGLLSGIHGDKKSVLFF